MMAARSNSALQAAASVPSPPSSPNGADSVLHLAESVTENRLDQQMVGRLGHADTHSKVELPALAEIDVACRYKHLLGIAHRIPASPRPIRAVILQAEGDALVNVVRHFYVGRETPARVLAGSVK